MKIYINGEEKTISENSTITSLVEEFSLNVAKVAVERNLAIVPRPLYAETILSDGDRIEIVQFIGGG